MGTATIPSATVTSANASNTTSNASNTVLTGLTNVTSSIAISVSTLTSEHQGSYTENDIIILHADTGRATVVVDKGDYDEKMNKMLDDEKTYKELECDLVSKDLRAQQAAHQLLCEV